MTSSPPTSGRRRPPGCCVAQPAAPVGAGPTAANSAVAVCVILVPLGVGPTAAVIGGAAAGSGQTHENPRPELDSRQIAGIILPLQASTWDRRWARRPQTDSVKFFSVHDGGLSNHEIFGLAVDLCQSVRTCCRLLAESPDEDPRGGSGGEGSGCQCGRGCQAGCRRRGGRGQ